MDIYKFVSIISIKYNIDYDELVNIIKDNGNDNDTITEPLENSNTNLNENIILPFNGIIDDNNCKGVVYNHGLYTQCKTPSKNYCKKCQNLKYGNIYERNKYKLGDFVTRDGKREVDYIAFVKKMNYNLDYVKKTLRDNNIFHIVIPDSFDKPKSRGRGRPKKQVSLLDNIKKLDDAKTSNEIEVEKFVKDGEVYYRTREDVILNSVYDIVGSVG
jgi:hypothetical protein